MVWPSLLLDFVSIFPIRVGPRFHSYRFPPCWYVISVTNTGMVWWICSFLFTWKNSCTVYKGSPLNTQRIGMQVIFSPSSSLHPDYCRPWTVSTWFSWASVLSMTSPRLLSAVGSLISMPDWNVAAFTYDPLPSARFELWWSWVQFPPKPHPQSTKQGTLEESTMSSPSRPLNTSYRVREFLPHWTRRYTRQGRPQKAVV